MGLLKNINIQNILGEKLQGAKNLVKNLTNEDGVKINHTVDTKPMIIIGLVFLVVMFLKKK
jgi:hypothetical protein